MGIIVLEVAALLLVWIPVLFSQLKLFLLPNFFRNFIRIIIAAASVLMFTPLAVNYVMGVLCKKFKIPLDTADMTDTDFQKTRLMFIVFGILLALGLVLLLSCIIKKPVLSTWYGEDDEELPYPYRCGVSCAYTSISCSVIIVITIIACLNVIRGAFADLQFSLDWVKFEHMGDLLWDSANKLVKGLLAPFGFVVSKLWPESQDSEVTKSQLHELAEHLIANSRSIVTAAMIFAFMFLLFYVYSRALAIAAVVKQHQVGISSTGTMIISIIGILFSLINIVTLIGVITSFITHKPPKKKSPYAVTD